MQHDRHQLVVFGATSFVGQILCHYLFRRHGVDGDLRWAMAGRSESRLQALRADLGPAAARLPLVLAEAHDEAALQAMCAGTAAVVSTVGPYAHYGSPLVKVCAESGTDYCDLSGEVQWIARMIEAHAQSAQRSGARIVHCCGFDSVPSDLGVHFLQQQSRRRYGRPCTEVKLRVKALRGGFSGGTVASLMNVIEESVQDPQVRRLLANPYALCPDAVTRDTPQPGLGFARFDPDSRSWIAPFVMAGINTRVVHRSNALSGNAYGEDFRYDEAMMTGSGARGAVLAAGMAAGLAGFVVAAALPPSRWALQKFVVPKPGEGPDPQAQENGFYDLRLFGRTAEGENLRVRVTGDRDPGYGSTAKILGEAAVCLAQDVPRSEIPGGFWTPATIFGDRLIQRLTAHAGLSFELLD